MALAIGRGGRWVNWGGNQACTPAVVERPASEDEIVAIVQRAADSGRRVKVVGAGHSFTDIACTDGVMISLERCDRVLAVDTEARQVTVDAGITIERLGDELARLGLAQPNLGDIGYQSIAGAISTSTHGTGIKLGNLASQVCALSMVLADGSVLHCAPERDTETFRAAQVGLGALGILSTVTLQCVPAFNLLAVEEPGSFDATLAELDALAAANEHFEFYWLPHTERVIRLLNNRTDAPARPKGKVGGWLDDVLLENHAFGLLCRLGRVRPGWIPTLNRLEARLLSDAKFSDRSDRVFTNPRLVRFVEMEYALPREALADAVRAVRALIESRGFQVSFPVEVRVGASDDITLSTAHGRETGYVAVHMFRGTAYDEYFGEVEAIMNGHDGRPHWGKMHYQTAQTLRPRYPGWDSFIAVRERLDPGRLFGNAYLERVLGA